MTATKAEAASAAAKMAVIKTGTFLNDVVSLIVFSVLDVLDFVLCYFYRVIDFLIEAEWKPCYCSSAKETVIATSCAGKILVSEQGGGGGCRDSKKIVTCLSSTTTTTATTTTANYKLQLEEVSDTLYTRPALVSEVSKSTVNDLKRLKVVDVVVDGGGGGGGGGDNKKLGKAISSKKKGNSYNLVRRSTFTVNSTIVEMLQGKIGGGGGQPVPEFNPIPRWSDCDCATCNSWASSSKETLYVKAEGATSDKSGGVVEDVIFIHGFISSSAFWTETLFPNFSESAKAKYRFIAVDLLGFGRSPKPEDSLYTLREHLEMIEKSVMEPYQVKSFHIVAHSLGCILALALAVKHPGAIKSLTLLAPPYFPAPKGVQATQYMMRKVAPRRVWPPIAFGSSIACWYEHLSRTVCLLICKNHRLWEFLTKLLTRNRIRTYLIEGFCCHTHNAAWHTLHNIICGTAGKMEAYLDVVKNRLKCGVTIFHGRDDELIPVECSFNVQSRIPRAHVKVVENKDHITIVVGRQKAFARELEEIWKS
ncbi:OLC1v1028854C2 [Oldenlandia corymbosa var. corymbosa]|uniref:OLC1v1028854C2 n=1 Tax=Oldenlandia corymbosa var. corymbosa TaxID=529605 RepID=A0AAV1CEA8_OLDCO|nr:OLC1v1028854C2 [Oldenlandia corymbosa var. corymbosa]